MRRVAGIAFGLALVALVAWRVTAALQGRRAPAGPAPPRAAVVEVEPASRKDLVREALYTGDVQAASTVDVFARVGGVVGRVLVVEGERVSPGQVLVRLDPRELRYQLEQAMAARETQRVQVQQAEAQLRTLRLQVDQARAALDVQRARLAQLLAGPAPEQVRQAEEQVRQARAAVEYSQAQLRRTEELYRQGFVPQQAVDAARTEVTVQEARLRAAEEQLAEDADLALVAAPHESALAQVGLVPLHRLLQGRAWLIANRHSLRSKDMGWLLSGLASCGLEAGGGLSLPGALALSRVPAAPPRPERDSVRIALPDGHQQRHVLEALAEAGLEFPGYAEGKRRLQGPWPRLEAKVVRPQDMPQMVALGAFDLAITGRDCLMEHLYRFPSSPVEMALDLGRGAFDMSAVVAADLPAATLAEALDLWRQQGKAVVRIASEFANIADHYARSRHFWRYRVIPTAGASEGFVPEDAELLIEGTETGRTLMENRLKAIDVIFRSTTCVIVRKGAGDGHRRRLVSELLERLARGAITASARM